MSRADEQNKLEKSFQKVNTLKQIEYKENTHSPGSLDVFHVAFLRNFLFPIQIWFLNVSSVSSFKDIKNLSQ
ncbi:hypothetical protein SUGI_0396680 [Cryptomeria japonica]|nr:hypothetical protein SUGI_0396680 [Cryptomeria japonica]